MPYLDFGIWTLFLAIGSMCAILIVVHMLIQIHRKTTPSTTPSTTPESYCEDNGCGCGILTENSQPYCYGGFSCQIGSCSSNADCDASNPGYICAYDQYGFCSSGSRICVSAVGCPQTIPQKMRRELEAVFEGARLAGLSGPRER